MTAITSQVTAPAAPAWQYALCAQTDPELFFPEGAGAQVTIATEQAKQVCAGCPIRRSCLRWALETQQPAGIWGGMDKHERRLVRRRAARRAATAKGVRAA